MKKGLFITFEGIDGCGKSTQAKMLSNYILDLDKYNNTLMTRAPYKNADIRKILQQDQDQDPYDKAESLAKLFIEDRRLQVKETINPNLNNGIHVISDRYSFSTFAYQQAQGVPLNKLIALHKGLPIPDIIFLVDVPVSIAMKRMSKDNSRKVKENKFEKNKEFIEKLRKNYLDLIKLKNHKVVIIDGTKSIQNIFEKQIKPAFDNFYNSKEQA